MGREGGGREEGSRRKGEKEREGRGEDACP